MTPHITLPVSLGHSTVNAIQAVAWVVDVNGQTICTVSKCDVETCMHLAKCIIAALNGILPDSSAALRITEVGVGHD